MWKVSKLPRLWYGISSILGLLGLLGCGNDGTPPEVEPAATDRALSRASEVYALPGGKILATLPARTPLAPTGRLSERLFPLYTPTDTLFEPYLEVILPDGRAGWVYARPDHWPLPADIPSARWQAENRIQALLGVDRLRDYRSYRQVWTQAQQGQPSPLLVQAFRSARSIRDELQSSLALYPEQPLAEADWKALLPGFTCQLTASGQVRWWIDYRQWLATAQQFGDEEAGMLFAIYCQVYPPDSIEYYYPVWKIAESPTVQHSLLGRGIHTRLLRALAPTQDFTSLAGIEASQVYEAVLDDILSSGTYWEGLDKILPELDTLLYSGHPPLDKVLGKRLEARRQTLVEAGESPPWVNVRAGQLRE